MFERELSSKARGRRRGRQLGLVLLAVAGAALLIFGGQWLFLRQSLAWQVRRGLELLPDVHNPAAVRVGLDRWEEETRSHWEGRRAELVNYLFDAYPLEDPRTRLLLTRVAGADYGAGREDWERWYEDHRRQQLGLPPQVGRREAVALELRWEAPIGLTAWFSTIIPLDGQIYVSSLGAEFDVATDVADGLVRVNGATGVAELFFSPPPEHRGPRDVIGIAAGEGGLFVACYNGTVYFVGFDARVGWSMHAGDPVMGPPLSIDANRDGTADVLVVTRGGKVVALNGRQGRTLWVANVSRPASDSTLIGSGLTLGDVLGTDEPEVVATLPTGTVEVLALRSGRSLARLELPPGTIAGPVSRSGLSSPGPPLYVGDRAATIWSLATSNQRAELVRWQFAGVRRDETLVAGLRTLAVRGVGAPATAPGPAEWLLACPTGEYAGRRGAVCALAADGIQWRYPVDGAVWSTPAVADLNGDGRAEIVVASIEPIGNAGLRGVLTVLSSTGHALARQYFDAAIECAPVVADVDGDARLDVLVADQSGRLYCLATHGYGPIEWGLYAGDSHNTRNARDAYAYGQAPFGYQARWTPR